MGGTVGRRSVCEWVYMFLCTRARFLRWPEEGIGSTRAEVTGCNECSYMSSGKLTGYLEEQQAFLTSKPSLQTHFIVFIPCVYMCVRERQRQRQEETEIHPYRFI